MIRMDLKDVRYANTKRGLHKLDKGRIKLVLSYDIFRRDDRENEGYPKQSAYRIRFYRVGAHLKQRVIPITKRIALFLFVSLIVSALFALKYEEILNSNRIKDLYNDLELQTLEVDGVQSDRTTSFIKATSSDDFPRILKNSFLIFQLWSIFTDNGQPEFLDNISKDTNGLAIDEFSMTMFLERIIGTIATACLIGSIASQFEGAINPIWNAPKIVIDTSDNSAYFDVRYWIRYPPDKWLHRVTLVLRIRSYDSDRSSENHQLLEYFYEENIEMRRGICRLRIDLKEDRKLLELITKMAAAKQTKKNQPSKTVKLWSSEVESFEDYALNACDNSIYEDYSIALRIIGTTDDGEEISTEYKYGIDDVLFGYKLVDPALYHEGTSAKKGTKCNIDGVPYADKYIYYLTWYIEPCEVAKNKDTDSDNTGIPLLDGLVSIHSTLYENDAYKRDKVYKNS